VPRSVPRAVAGGGSALLAAGLLALAMIHVIGQRSCPERMGVDRGIQVAAQMLDAWRKGEAAPADVWASAAVADAWRSRVGKLTLIDYKVVDSGCWERLAPVATQRTWHEFRVTVQQRDGRFSKVMTVSERPGQFASLLYDRPRARRRSGAPVRRVRIHSFLRPAPSRR